MSNENEPSNIRILALNGGGVRGLYTISVLAEFERILSDGDESYSIAQHFDLIAGTSIGGLLALGLADGKTARELKAKMLQHATTIFPPRPKYVPKFCWEVKNVVLACVSNRYKSENLHEAIVDIVGDDRTIRHLKRRVLIPTVNIGTGKPVFVKTCHNPNFYRDDQLNLIDVASATSAAPTYFKPHLIEKLSSYFVDGGLVANNPSYVAYHEAMIELKDEFNIQSPDQIYILNIGTMGGEYCINPENIEKKITGYFGLWGAGTALIETVMVGNQWMHHFMANRALSATNHIVLDDVLSNQQAQLISLDNSRSKALEALNGRGKQRAIEALADKSLNLNEKFFKDKAPEFVHPKDQQNVKATQMEPAPVSV